MISVYERVTKAEDMMFIVRVTVVVQLDGSR